MASTTKILLDAEYLPKELPKNFSSEGLEAQDFIVKELWKKLKADFRSGRHSHPRDAQRRRPLSIPNPVPYAALVSEISAGYKDIYDFCKGSKLSKSRIRPRSIALKRITPDLNQVNFAGWQAPILQRKRFLLSLDITRFYPSIYTHSIPWALHSKAVAKKHQKDDSLLGNRLDAACRRMQSNQTVGLPIGPSTSFVISEIISTAIECEVIDSLNNDQVEGYRYLDDWFLGSNDRTSLERAYAGIRKAAQDFELSINEDKTQILSNEAFRQDPWRHSFVEKAERALAKKTSSAIDNFFEHMYDVRATNMSAHVARYAIGTLLSSSAHLYVASAALPHLLRALIAAPEAGDKILQCIRDCVEVIGGSCAKDIEETLIDRLKDYVLAIHDGEAAFLLWYFKTQKSKLPDSLVSEILMRMGPVCKILALDLHFSNGGAAVVPGLGLGPVTDDDLTGPDWLFHYERWAYGWTAGVGLTSKSDPFKSLKKADFHFYRREVEMPLNKLEEEEAEDDGDWFYA